MVTTVMYTVAITTIGIMLIGMMAFDAEAKKFDKDYQVILIGDSFSVRDKTTAIISIQPIDDNPKFVKLTYNVMFEGTSGNGKDCIAKNNILKISAMKKATVKFDTNDLDCKMQKGDHGVVSLSFQADGEIIHTDSDNTMCSDIGDGVEECLQVKGTLDEVSGIVSGTAFGKSLKEDTLGNIGQINELRKMWTTS